MICDKCGQEVQEGNAFCTNCGAAVSQAPPSGGQPAAPPPPGAQATPPAGPAPAPPGIPAAPAVPPTVPPPSAPAAGPPARKSNKGLKIALISVAALAVIAAVVLVLVFVVFSSNTGEAKELMDKGDAKMQEIQTSGDAMGEALGELLGSMATVTSAADYEVEADKIRKQLDSISSDLAAAEKYYKDIQDLNGVDDYKEYAGIVLELIDSNKQLVQVISDYLDYLGEQYAAADAGQAVDTEAISETTATFVEDVQELGTTSDELEAKAKDLKKEKDL